MPRLVDHAEKREQIVGATWRLVATRGFEAATMREIAGACGLANGALSHYFANKEELLRATYLFVWEQTNLRIAARLGQARGLAAVRIFWEEISPSTDVARLEAHIVLPFIARAAHEPVLGAITARTLDRWRESLTDHLEQARADGDVTVAVGSDQIAEQLMLMLLGLQLTVAETPVADPAVLQRDLLSDYLRLLGAAEPRARPGR